MSRSNTTRRSAILAALADKFKEIDGAGAYKTRLDDNVHTRMKFWDEIEQFPAVHMSAGAETREYWGGGNKWRFLTIMIRAYVNSEDPIQELEELLEDSLDIIYGLNDFRNSWIWRGSRGGPRKHKNLMQNKVLAKTLQTFKNVIL